MPFDFAAARLNMVESQIRTVDVTSPELQGAFRVIEREKICPPEKIALAYADAEVPCGEGRFMMRPRDVSKVLMALNPRPGESALAIAAPYAAAVLQQLGLKVERADGEDLTSIPPGPFDIIVSEGAVDRAPQSWLDAIAEGGRLCVVERRGPVGKARLYMRNQGGVGSREVFDSAAPLLPQFEPRPSFAF